VADEDREKTTFVCHEGAYRYIRRPFGLSNAQATFQRAIDMILGGLKWKSCLVYFDDIIVFLQSVGESVEHLRENFAVLRGAHVPPKAKKCHLFQEEVEYLGHIIGRGQLQVQDKNIRGLKVWYHSQADPTRAAFPTGHPVVSSKTPEVSAKTHTHNWCGWQRQAATRHSVVRLNVYLPPSGGSGLLCCPAQIYPPVPFPQPSGGPLQVGQKQGSNAGHTRRRGCAQDPIKTRQQNLRGEGEMH